MKKLFILTVLSTVTFLSFSQSNQLSIGYQLGGAHYLGEIGNGDGVARKGPADVQLAKTRINTGVFLTYHFNRMIGISGNLLFVQLAGADRETKNVPRRDRNLSFRTNIVELSTQGEFTLFSSNRFGHKYRLIGVVGTKKFNMQIYSFIGIGGIYFNPTAEFKYNPLIHPATLANKDGEFVDLQPLRTEGQTTPYGLFALVIPTGLGVNFRIYEKIKLGYELSWRITTTDYLDDASTNYSNPGLDSDLARAMADRSQELVAEGKLDPGQYFNYLPPSKLRGNPKDNDSYLLSVVKISMLLEPSGKQPIKPKYKKVIKHIKPEVIKAKPKDNN